MDASRMKRSSLSSGDFPRRGRDWTTAGVSHYRVAMALALLLSFSTFGCNEDDDDTSQAGFQDDSLASLDARGAGVEMTTLLQDTNLLEGRAGSGGTVRVTSASGNVTITDAPVLTAPQTPFFSGSPNINVVPGAKLEVRGLHQLDFLRVQEGGVLRLVGDTFFDVTGDVEIAGVVTTKPIPGSIDGNDLTIVANGYINITGTIDCSGQNNVVSGSRLFLSGGNGGEVFVYSRASLIGLPPPHVFVSGVVKANGGAADQIHFNDMEIRAGRGGEVFVGTRGSMVVNGKLAARGGRLGYTLDISFADGLFASGGDVALVALQDIELGSAREIDASGGNSDGVLGGNGGEIAIEAPAGTVTADGCDVLARGGDVLFASTSVGGIGGLVVVVGDSTDLDNLLVDASGGGVGRGTAPFQQNVEGVGSDGGTIQVAGVTAMDFGTGLELRSDGGDSNLLALSPGAGGDVMIVNLRESNLGVIDFQGAVSARGGRDAQSTLGGDGVVCVRGASGDDINRITAANNFPISFCAVDIEGEISGARFIAHDLDDDSSTLFPAEVTAELPVVVGADFYRVQAQSGCITVRLRTDIGAAIEMFAGDDADLGSLDPGVYEFPATVVDSTTQTVTIDLDQIATQFVTVLVRGTGPFVESYTLDVSASASCN